MEKLNQLFFVVFALFLLGLYLSTVRTSSDEHAPYMNWFWPTSILSRAAAFLIWAAVPILGNSLLVFANLFYMLSLVSLLFTFRSWRIQVSKRLLIIAIIFLVAYAVVFQLVIDSFIQRTSLFISCLVIISMLELFELLRNLRRDRTFLLSLIFLMAFMQLVMAGFTVELILDSYDKKVTNLLQNAESGSIAIWLTFGLHLVIYVVINSFLYQKLWESEKQTNEKLKQSKLALTGMTAEQKEIKSLLKERDSLVARLLKANKTVSTGALSASIAHELNQPLTVIQMNIRLLGELTKDKNQPIDEKMQTELIEEILDNNRRASKVVKSLREIFSQSPKDFERVDIIKIIRSVIEISRGELQHQNIKLDLVMPDEAYANVFPQEILQIILNLLNNAINALSKSSQTSKNIRIVLTKEDERILINIEDNGPGVTPKMRGQLFELLAETKGTGMGLGLWLCKYVVNHHDGKIWYESVQTGGARFCLEFPDNLVSYKILS